MAKKPGSAAANRLGLRLVISHPIEETPKDKAKKFADFLEREYDLANRGSIGGLRFANCIEVKKDYPEPDIVSLAMEILRERGYDTEPTDYSDATGRRGTVWLTPRDPNG